MKGITLRKHRKTYFPKLFGLVFISLPGLEPYQLPVDETMNSMASQAECEALGRIIRNQRNEKTFFGVQ
jgi:hypothetical protein